MEQPTADVTEALGDKPAERGIQRVLIVDDSLAHLKLMSNVLIRWGFDVIEARSGQEALELLGRERVDLVLSDWVMPGMTGLEMCRAFRAKEDTRYTYFILLTSKTAREDVAIGLEAGADDFLSKPISPEELKARISAGERLVAMQRTLEERNTQLAGALDELQSLYDGVARDLVEARRLQQSLVPDRCMSFPGAEVSLLLRPCGHVGGDLVGAFPVEGGRLCIYAIDVSGHGIASALMTARLAGYLTGSSPDHNVALTTDETGAHAMLPLPEVCARLNATILADMETELYFTMVIADLDLATGAFSIAQAGHPHPLIQRAGGKVEYIDIGGMPVGLFETAEYLEHQGRLFPGDRLFLHSDGFSEATDGRETMLDKDGLSRLVTGLSDETGQDFLEALVWKLSEFTGSGDFEDDLSGVLLEYAGPPPDRS